ncbi:MAG: thioredoxin domain-containing protein, partial [Deltaproteobacteria bacterium]|nr:thioredoxin domain-containing protein [Deltaproteobacteria bacterium]
LNNESFRECVQSGRHKASVENDIAEARRIGVDRTPSFIINGRLATGVPALEDFKRMIEEELNRSKSKS